MIITIIKRGHITLSRAPCIKLNLMLIEYLTKKNRLNNENKLKNEKQTQWIYTKRNIQNYKRKQLG